MFHLILFAFFSTAAFGQQQPLETHPTEPVSQAAPPNTGPEPTQPALRTGSELPEAPALAPERERVLIQPTPELENTPIQPAPALPKNQAKQSANTIRFPELPPAPTVAPAHAPTVAPAHAPTVAPAHAPTVAVPALPIHIHDLSVPTSPHGPKLETETHPQPEEPAISVPKSTAMPLLPTATTEFINQLPIPKVVTRGRRKALLLITLTLTLLWLANRLSTVKTRFLTNGLLPRLVGSGQLVLRLGALTLLIGALGAIVPSSIAPALPYVLIGAALALGWSLRDVLPDLIAGVAISMEDQIKPGFWIEGSHYKGTVEKIGFRAVWMRETSGRRVSIPNRFMLSTPLSDDQIHFPAVEVRVTLPESVPSKDARRLLTEMVLVSPWVAPGNPPLLIPTEDGAWRIRARLLEGHFAEFFEGGLRERVQNITQVRTELP